MRKRMIEFVVLLMVALGAGPVGAAIWQWSTTAGSNASADPSINWAEGMAPSAVNDSARAMMAALASWRNDISATNTTGGSSTAYTLTTSEGVNTTPANGQMLAAIFHATNGVAPTLTVDGGTTYPIWLNGAAVSAATLVAGSPYRFAFNSANSAWYLEGGFASPFSTALGGIMWSTSPTAPNSNFVAPYGQCISTTTYAAYWVQQGSPASGSCPGGQFAIIDMRGRVPAALDTLPGSSAANRLTSSSTGCGTAMTSAGTVCANGVEGSVIPLAQLPTGITSANTGSISLSVTSTVSNIDLGAGGFTAPANPGAVSGVNGTGSVTSTGTIAIGNAAVTSNNTSGTARPNVQPTIGLIPYLRIL